MITLKELAVECGVSIATISNILNGKSNVSEKTKQRVLKVIEQTGYKPNYMARTLRAHKTNTVGLIIDDIGAFSSPNLIEGVLNLLEAQGYKAIIETLRLYSKWSNKPDSAEYGKAVRESVDEMLSIKVDGIIFIAAHAHDIEYFPKGLDVPIVIAYAYQTDNSIPAIKIDDFESSYIMTKHLIEKGHKKIAIVGGGVNDRHEQDRLEGFEKAMTEASLPVDKELFELGYWSREGGKEACSKLFKKSTDFTCIFCFNDLMAAGVYDYLYEIGRQPGKDYAVAGFDNREMSDYLTPALTTMEIPLEEIGHEAAEVLLKKIDGIEIDNNDIKIPCRLIKRQSV
ncbi:MAG: LacI family DNA-binding transcriptional regulator [Treponema sp.]|nr:LacI family DNA-binding transcriptional regulator [Treponema sp.]